MVITTTYYLMVMVIEGITTTTTTTNYHGRGTVANEWEQVVGAGTNDGSNGYYYIHYTYNATI